MSLCAAPLLLLNFRVDLLSRLNLSSRNQLLSIDQSHLRIVTLVLIEVLFECPAVSIGLLILLQVVPGDSAIHQARHNGDVPLPLGVFGFLPLLDEAQVERDEAVLLLAAVAGEHAVPTLVILIEEKGGFVAGGHLVTRYGVHVGKQFLGLGELGVIDVLVPVHEWLKRTALVTHAFKDGFVPSHTSL